MPATCLAYDSPIFDARIPEEDLRDPIWFDDWSEGPITLEEVEQCVSTSPSAANDYHICGTSITYRQALPERLAIIEQLAH